MSGGHWWPCPSCGETVPVSYQLDESYADDGRAEFDPSAELAPAREGLLTASWMAVVRCPNPDCELAWVFTLYPADKSMFALEAG